MGRGPGSAAGAGAPHPAAARSAGGGAPHEDSSGPPQGPGGDSRRRAAWHAGHAVLSFPAAEGPGRRTRTLRRAAGRSRSPAAPLYTRPRAGATAAARVGAAGRRPYLRIPGRPSDAHGAPGDPGLQRLHAGSGVRSGCAGRGDPGEPGRRRTWPAARSRRRARPRPAGRRGHSGRGIARLCFLSPPWDRPAGAAAGSAARDAQPLGPHEVPGVVAQADALAVARRLRPGAPVEVRQTAHRQRLQDAAVGDDQRAPARR